MNPDPRTMPPAASPPTPPPKSGALAIAALIVSILALISACFPPVSLLLLLVAFVLAVIGVVKPPRMLAAIAIVVCAFALVLNVATLIWYFTVFARPAATLPMTADLLDDPSDGFKVFYYDLSSGKVFAGPSDALPPIETPSRAKINGQPAGVRAHVLSCGDCNDPKQRYVGYLETYTEERKQAMLDPMSSFKNRSGKPMGADEGHLVARGNLEGGWAEASSAEGMKVVSESRKGCKDPNAWPLECIPGQHD